MCSENGKLTLNVTVPDTITTWIADAFALSNTAAFGMTNVPSSLVAFKPFFVSLSLPYSVVRREEVEIIATVFNYYHEDLQVRVVKYIPKYVKQAQAGCISNVLAHLLLLPQINILHTL